MIVSYYSYKGGVGRSMVCANIAAYLCHQHSMKILLWDWDFEAPGLHYFFDRSDEDLQKCSGTLEMLEEYVFLMRTKDNVSISDLKFFAEDSFFNLVSQRPEDSRQGKQGRIDLIPAGAYLQQFISRVNYFDWAEFSLQLDGASFIELLKKYIKEELDYDFVFIDSRTGITDYSGYCNIQLPDINVVVMAANHQNITGSKRIIDKILHHPYTQDFRKAPFVLPILSRLDSGHSEYEDWIGKFCETFSDLLPKLDSKINSLFLEEIFLDVYATSTVLKYVPNYSAGEHILFTQKMPRISPGSFRAKFTFLSNFLVQLKEEGKLFLYKGLSIEDWTQYAEKAVEEYEHIKAAQAYDNAGLVDKSIEFGGTPRAYRIKGLEKLEVNEFEAAVLAFEKAVELNPKDIETLTHLAEAYKQTKHYERAIHYFERAKEVLDGPVIDTSNERQIRQLAYRVYDGLGFCYYKEQDFPQAEEFLESALSINKENPESNLLYVRVKQNQMLFEDAIKACEEMILLHPKNIEFFLLKAQLLLEAPEKKDEAVLLLAKAKEIQSSDHRAWVQLGNIYFSSQEYKLALIEYDGAVLREPRLIEVWKQLIYAAEQVVSAREVYQYMLRAETVFPDDTSIKQMLLGKADLIKFGEPEFALYSSGNNRFYKMIFEGTEISNLGSQFCRILYTLLSSPNQEFDMYMLYNSSKVLGASGYEKRPVEFQADLLKLVEYVNTYRVKESDIINAVTLEQRIEIQRRLRQGIRLLGKVMELYPELEVDFLALEYQNLLGKYFTIPVEVGFEPFQSGERVASRKTTVSPKIARERISKQLSSAFRHIKENELEDFYQYLTSVIVRTEENGIHYYSFIPNAASKEKWRNISWQLTPVS